MENIKLEEGIAPSSNTLSNNLSNYRTFKDSYILLANSSGALFCKSFVSDDDNIELTLLKKAGAKDEWADRPVIITVVENDKIVKKAINVVDLAINGYQKYCDVSSASKELEQDAISMKRWHGLCFKPQAKTTQKYNLFKGFPVTPKKGDISIFLDLLDTIVGKDEASIILDYFAHMYQKPQEKPRYALIFKGTKGVGKNTIEEMLGRGLLRRENYYRTPNKEQFFGKFNAHLQQNLLSVMQELVWDGSNNYDSILKDMITEQSRAVEKKYVDQEMMDNYSRIIMTTNEQWVVPASGKDERRYCIITFPSKKPEGIDNLFTDLYMWYNDGGKEALMDEMLNRDISEFTINKAPYTKGLSEQLSYSLKGIEKFCADGLNNGYFGNLHKTGYSSNYAFCYANEKLRIKRITLYECYKFNHKSTNLDSQTAFHKKMTELLGCKIKAQPDTSYTQFLSIEESLKKFTEATGIPVEAEPDTWLQEEFLENDDEKVDTYVA